MRSVVVRQAIHSETMTVARFEMCKGWLVPEHSHPQRADLHGRAGTRPVHSRRPGIIVGAGQVLLIPPHVPHSAEALEDAMGWICSRRPRDWIRGDDAYMRKVAVDQSVAITERGFNAPSVRLDRAALELATNPVPRPGDRAVSGSIERAGLATGGPAAQFQRRPGLRRESATLPFRGFGFSRQRRGLFDPQNSCLNQVLARRTGIPISLSVLYMEIARRLQMPVFGIGLPRHFVFEFNDGNYATYIDPYWRPYPHAPGNVSLWPARSLPIRRCCGASRRRKL